MSRQQNGFTLIELLVVIAIISILAVTVAVSIGGARNQAKNARRLADLRNIRTALEIYYNDYSNYPDSGGDWDGVYTLWGDATTDWIPGLAPTYIDALPRDPRNDTEPLHQYLYRSDDTDYKIISFNPEGCDRLQQEHPSLADPVRTDATNDNCAIGYWTPGGANW